MYKIKQVIVIRKDLNMRRGKMIAQGAHASMKVLVDMMTFEDKSVTIPSALTPRFAELSLFMPKSGCLYEWLNNSFVKIVLYVNSEEELLDLYKQAKEKHLPCALIQDEGRTEFHGIKTYTCIAIGPALSEEIDKITGHLKLL